MKRTGLFSILLGIVILMASCRSERSMIKAPIKEAGPDYLLSQLEEHELKFNSFKAKFSIRYAKGSDKSTFKGNIRIKKDSLIWVSIAPILGIEMARIMITPDSVKVIDRQHKSYFMEEYAYVNRFLNNALDFDMLQAYLLGNDFSFYEKAGWKVNIDGGLYRLATANRRKLKKFVKANQASEIPIQKTWLDPQTFKIKKVMIKEIRDSRSRKLTAEYDNFYIISKQLFPLHAEYNLRASKNIHVILDYSKVSLNQDMKYPFHISSKYKEVQIAE